MVKKQKKKLSFSIPTPIAVASLAVNLVLFLTFVAVSVIERNGSTDYITVNSGIDRMCSDQFRKTVEKTSKEQGDSANEKGLRLALVDYPCVNNGAEKFYEKGYDDYVRSLGLNPDI